MKKRQLTTQESMGLQKKRKFIESMLASDEPKHHTAAEKLSLLNLMIKQKTFTVEHEFQIDSMGVLLGDVLCQVLGLEWVIVEDENGISPAVCYPDMNIFSFPIDVIWKRLKREEDVEVFYLFVGLAESMNKKLQSGNYNHG